MRPLDDPDFIWPELEAIIKAHKAMEEPPTPAILHDDDILTVIRVMLAESRLAETEWDYLHPVVQENLNQPQTQALGGTSTMFAFTGLDPTIPLNIIAGSINRKLYADSMTEINWERQNITIAMNALRQSLQEIHSKF
ncbi:hypothetical protein H310_04359 [Aphanomyces invadans]|uniref:Uncharacterized protein n=1 Tax=Aphanomyces invadans TaxID=157072 RepID=A0A024UCH3_9STRA|nr:hypothetical protein H310_04359 [Aphanomyces invadans]ETW03944.1 hypothetical protein H310_04359 [Aphanomyces invadans]|eukprot:XP_008866900.1 hypothetical protein H310_04359 [Aphanomyces invadans]